MDQSQLALKSNFIILNRLRKLCIIFLLVLISLLLIGCQNNNKSHYEDNPYFIDTSQHDYADVISLKSIYDQRLLIYYNDTYAFPARENKFAYQWLDGYESFPVVPILDKDILGMNHDIIDQRELYRYSQMIYFLDDDRLSFASYIDVNKCNENKSCYYDDNRHKLHYALHEDQLYIHYYYETQFEKYAYTYYYALDENQKLFVEFQRIRYGLETNNVVSINYAKYLEDDYELNFMYNGIFHIRSYHLATSEVIQKSIHSDTFQEITHFNPDIDIDFVYFMNAQEPLGNSYLKIYNQNQMVFRSNIEMTYVMIGLNHIDGWNKLHIDHPNGSESSGQIYQDDNVVDQSLIIHWDSIIGMVYYIPNDSYPYYLIDEELITLSRFGLNSGFNYAWIADTFNTHQEQLDEAIHRHDLDVSYDEIVLMFENLFNVQLD